MLHDQPFTDHFVLQHCKHRSAGGTLQPSLTAHGLMSAGVPPVSVSHPVSPCPGRHRGVAGSLGSARMMIYHPGAGCAQQHFGVL